MVEDQKLKMEDHLGLVRATFNKHFRRRLLRKFHDDVLSEGYLGLASAIEKFDPNKGSFGSYATRTIWGFMISYYNRFILRKSRHAEAALNHFNESDLRAMHGDAMPALDLLRQSPDAFEVTDQLTTDLLTKLRSELIESHGKRDGNIIYQRVIYNDHYKTIGKRFGLSHERTRQIANESVTTTAIERLKAILQDDCPGSMTHITLHAAKRAGRETI